MIQVFLSGRDDSFEISVNDANFKSPKCTLFISVKGPIGHLLNAMTF